MKLLNLIAFIVVVLALYVEHIEARGGRGRGSGGHGHSHDSYGLHELVSTYLLHLQYYKIDTFLK